MYKFDEKNVEYEIWFDPDFGWSENNFSTR